MFLAPFFLLLLLKSGCCRCVCKKKKGKNFPNSNLNTRAFNGVDTCRGESFSFKWISESVSRKENKKWMEDERKGNFFWFAHACALLSWGPKFYANETIKLRAILPKKISKWTEPLLPLLVNQGPGGFVRPKQKKKIEKALSVYTFFGAVVFLLLGR